MLIDEGEVHVLSMRMNLAAGGGGAVARGNAQTRSNAARIATCEVLGQYLEVPAAQVQIVSAKYGKPQLAAPSPLRFNLSHSGDLLVIALALGIEVGVDVEHVRSMPRASALAGRFFHAAEAAALDRVPASDLDRAFFCCWTRKEAYLKAIGLGMHAEMQSFRVACEPATPASIEWIADDDAACWRMHAWEPCVGYTAALALRDRERSLRIFPLLQATRPSSATKESEVKPAETLGPYPV